MYGFKKLTEIKKEKELREKKADDKNGENGEQEKDSECDKLGPFYDSLKKMCLLINSHLLQSAKNEVAIYGSFPHEAIFLGPDSSESTHLKFGTLSSTLIKQIESLFEDPDFQIKMANETKGFSKIGSALKKSS